MTRGGVLLPVAAVLAASTVRPVAAQEPGGRCDLVFENTASTRLTSTKLPSGRYNSFIGGGVIAHCAGQDLTLKSDSAEYYDEQNLLYLIGNVHYTEPRVRVDSRRMTYYRNEERLVAEGDVNAVLPSGTTMLGPQAEYYRDVPRLRPNARMIATGRPHMSLVQVDSLGRKSEPVQLVANQVHMDGDSLVYASGQVEITRSDVEARSDSAMMDNGREFARLIRSPVIRGKQQRPFTLSGSVIDLFSKDRQLQRVVSTTGAKAVSQDVNLTADTIDLRVTQNLLDRAYAWGPSRARATSPDRDIVADSIDVVMPHQRTREVRAVRKAFAQTAPDSTKVRSGERDWLRGDTIVARFDSLAPADSAKRPRVRELVAYGNATSFYQIPSKQGSPAKPAINYVRGRNITVAFRSQQVQTVTVVDRAAGLYLEPVADSGRSRGKTAPAKAPAPAAAPVPTGRRP